MDLPLISKIVTRSPNSSLEPPFLGALLTIRRVREGLKVASNVEWEFRSTAALKPPLTGVNLTQHHKELRNKGTVLFNIGDEYGEGIYDHHGSASLDSVENLCSLNFIQAGGYDFVDYRSWIADVLCRIGTNDSLGTSVSQDSWNIRKLMTGLSAMDPLNHRYIFDVLVLAFQGAFSRSRAIYRDPDSQEDVLSLASIMQGVAECSPDRLDWFKEQTELAEAALNAAWKQALADVDKAKEIRDADGKQTKVWHPKCRLAELVGKKALSVIEIHSDAINAAQASRLTRPKEGRYGFDVAVIHRSNGHCQITCRDLKAKEGPQAGKKFRLDLAEATQRLRILESKMQNRSLENTRIRDWAEAPMVYFTDGSPCPWYRPQFKSSIMNGSLSAFDMPPTQIRHDRIFKTVVQSIPDCGIMVQGEDGTWQYFNE